MRSSVTVLAIGLLLSGAGSVHPQNRPPTMAPLQSRGGEAPLPVVGEGAPNYSPEQTAGALCEALDGVGAASPNTRNLVAAHEATVRARKARSDFNAATISRRDLEQAELERQRAVRRVVSGPLQVSDLAPTRNGFALSEVGHSREVENGRPVLRVTGRIRNTTATPLEIPPVSTFSVDVRGFILAGQTNALSGAELAPGESLAFELRFKNPPEYTARVHLALAPPFQLRNYRGCGFLDPENFDARNREARLQRVNEAAAAPSPGSTYSVSELAVMGRVTYDDAIDAFVADSEVRKGRGARGRDPCAPIQPWRQLMAQADRIEEAWIAASAAREARRDLARGVFLAAEVAEAERREREAVAAFVAARPKSREAEAPPRLTLVRTSQMGRRRSDPMLTIKGVIRNDRATPVVDPAVRVTVKDELGYVSVDRLVRPQVFIPPNSDQPFDVTIYLPPRLVADAQVRLAC